MSIRRSVRALVFAFVCLVSPACSDMDPFDADDDAERIPVSPDLRAHARDARANLVHLPAEMRALLEPLVAAHEAAIREYDRLMAMGQTRRATTSMLYGAGAYIVANDATGIGIADDVALPFLALGVVAVHLTTDGSAESEVLRRARKRIRDSGQDVTNAFSRMDELDEPIAAPGTREHCIDTYVDCQLNGRRNFPRGACQRCMDWCMGAPFKWPDKPECRYK